MAVLRTLSNAMHLTLDHDRLELLLQSLKVHRLTQERPGSDPMVRDTLAGSSSPEIMITGIVGRIALARVTSSIRLIPGKLMFAIRAVISAIMSSVSRSSAKAASRCNKIVA